MAIVKDTCLGHELGMNGVTLTTAKNIIECAYVQNKLLMKEESFYVLKQKNTVYTNYQHINQWHFLNDYSITEPTETKQCSLGKDGSLV